MLRLRGVEMSWKPVLGILVLQRLVGRLLVIIVGRRRDLLLLWWLRLLLLLL
jgi:hypothetical protein